MRPDEYLEGRFSSQASFTLLNVNFRLKGARNERAYTRAVLIICHPKE
jgi:hypothetical protein